jgi:hypothetical protein
MARKKDKNVVQFEASLAFPTHDEIEENLQRRLSLWADPGRKVRYPLPVLDFLINAIACELETGEDDPEFGQDKEFYNSNWYTAGITNGELFYSLYQTIRQMSSDEQFDFSHLPLCDQEAFFSILDLAITLFLDRRKEPELADEGLDLWILYAWIRKLDKLAVWYDEKSESVLPPALGQLTDDDWEDIAEDVTQHFSEDGDDEFIEIALLDEQLHCPTFQEFRSAKAHLLKWADRTRANAKARERVDASGA